MKDIYWFKTSRAEKLTVYLWLGWRFNSTCGGLNEYIILWHFPFRFDYGEKFWIIKWKQFTCTCGSPKCKYSKETIHLTIADFERRQREEDVIDVTVP